MLVTREIPTFQEFIERNGSENILVDNSHNILGGQRLLPLVGPTDENSGLSIPVSIPRTTIAGLLVFANGATCDPDHSVPSCVEPPENRFECLKLQFEFYTELSKQIRTAFRNTKQNFTEHNYWAARGSQNVPAPNDAIEILEKIKSDSKKAKRGLKKILCKLQKSPETATAAENAKHYQAQDAKHQEFENAIKYFGLGDESTEE